MHVLEKLKYLSNHLPAFSPDTKSLAVVGFLRLHGIESEYFSNA